MTLAQNKTIQVLKLTGADVRHHGLLKLTGADVRDCRLESKILEGKAKGDLTQYPVMKQLMNHIQLGVLKNTTLERVELDFPPWLSGCIKRELMWCYSHMIIFHFYALATQLLSVSGSLSVQLLVFCTMTVIYFSKNILSLDILRHCDSNRCVNAFVFL